MGRLLSNTLLRTVVGIFLTAPFTIYASSSGSLSTTTSSSDTSTSIRTTRKLQSKKRIIPQLTDLLIHSFPKFHTDILQDDYFYDYWDDRYDDDYEYTPYGEIATGLTCDLDSFDEDSFPDCERQRQRDGCKSGVCDSGICVETDQCIPFLHEHGEPVRDDHVVFVLVGSGFGDNEWEDFIWDDFAEDIPEIDGVFDNFLYSIFYVESYDDESFCSYNCDGISQLLCCDEYTTRYLTDKCFSSDKSNVFSIVVHNDDQYGGAGYTDSNIVTVSTDYRWPNILLHELGHTFFNLVDEYSYGSGTSSGANCDSSSCSKWSDLIGDYEISEEFGEVQCKKGCRGNAYRIGQESLMGDIYAPLGAVNTRFTCCTWLYHTGDLPYYCDIFDFWSSYLESYCENDYQDLGFWRSHNGTQSSASDTSKYISVDSSMKTAVLQLDTTNMVVDVEFNGTKARSEDLSEAQLLLPRYNVLGYNTAHHRERAKSHGKMIRITVEYVTGEAIDYFVSNLIRVHVPPPADTHMIEDGSSSSQQEQDQRVGSIEIESSSLRFLIEDGTLVRNVSAQFEDVI